MGDIKKVYMVNISTQIIQILSVLILVFYFGIWGAVFARLFTRFYNALLLVYLTRQQ
jgi:hypothetical protein